jgi:hypothetical protein
MLISVGAQCEKLILNPQTLNAVIPSEARNLTINVDVRDTFDLLNACRVSCLRQILRYAPDDMHREAQHLMLRDRVVPLQRFESGEIGVGLEHTVVFDRKGCQVRVRGKVAGCFSVAKHALENRPLFVARMNDAHARLFEPALHGFNGFPDRERALMQSRCE